MKLAENTFISKYGAVLGNAELGENVSVWPKAVIRADVESVKIGANSNVQDGSIIHPNRGKPVMIGENVTIGHNAIVHGCTIGDNCLIGMGAIILDGAVIEDNCIVAAGSIVPSGMTVKAGTLVMGSPAKYFRDTNDTALDRIKRNAREYVMLARHSRDSKEDFI